MFRKIKQYFSKESVILIHSEEDFLAGSSIQTPGLFDLSKFSRIREKLIREGLITKKNFLSAPRLTDDDILLAHSRQYLYRLADPTEVGRILGLGHIQYWDTQYMEYFRYVSGGTVLGLKLSLTTGLPVINLGGGFHHAKYDRGDGFCLINDVAIAIHKCWKRHASRKFFIIDLDYHQGNGIMSYFAGDKRIFIISMNAASWDHFESENILNIDISSNILFSEYMKLLQHYLPEKLHQFNPDSVIFLAGHDVAETDELGDMRFSEEEILERDSFVYSLIRGHKKPILILSAGGYGTVSWKYYYNFIKWIILHKKFYKI